MKSKNDEKFHQEEQAKRAGETPADIGDQYSALRLEIAAPRERSDNLLRNGVLGPPPWLEGFERAHAARKPRTLQAPLLQDLDAFQQDKDAERKRLRAEREAHEPESEPEPILREPTDEEAITVAAAAWLLHARYIRPLETKPDDSAIHRELIKDHKSLERRELEELILHWGREGPIDDLIDPILEIPVARPPNPHRYWLIGPKAFETVRNKLTNGHEPVVIETAASPITACDAEHRPAALRHEPGGAAAVGLLGNQRLPDTAADTDVANSDDSAAPYNLRAKSHTKLGPLDPRDEGRVKEGKQMVIDRKARSANHAARIIAERDASHNDQAKEAMRDRIGRAIREALTSRNPQEFPKTSRNYSQQ